MKRILLASMIIVGATAYNSLAEGNKSIFSADFHQAYPGQPLVPEIGSKKRIKVDDIRKRNVYNRNGEMVGRVRDVILTTKNEYFAIIEGSGEWRGKDLTVKLSQIFLANGSRLSLYPSGSEDTPPFPDSRPITRKGYPLPGSEEVYVNVPK